MSTTTHSDTDAQNSKPDWYAEVELRRHLTQKYPDYNWRPDLKAAEVFEPDREYPVSGGEGVRGRTVHNDLKRLSRRYDFEYQDDKIRFPLGSNYDLEVSLTEDTDAKAPQTYDWRSLNAQDLARERRPLYLQVLHLMSERDPRPVYLQIPPDHDLCKLQSLWEKRREQNRDLKGIVYSRDAQTGTGKSTLAVALAKTWDSEGWTADKATLKPNEYLDLYLSLDPGEILLGDELEQMAHKRRSMSNENMMITSFWNTMRQWEVSTIATLPSAADTDKDLRKLCDFTIVVHRRGVGVVYKTKVDDHSGEITSQRLHRIRWTDLDDDSDYQQLAQMKEKHMQNHSENLYFLTDDDDEQEPEEAIAEYRLNLIEEMTDAGYTQQEIADLLPDISDRSTVSKILSD